MSLPVDRWFELGIAWFHPDTMERQVRLLFDRLAPLCEGVTGSRGLSLDLGMYPDILLTFEGTLDQQYPRISPRISNWFHATFADLKRLIDLLRREAAQRGIDGFRIGTYMQGGGGSNPEGDVNPMYTFNAPFHQRHPEAYHVVNHFPHLDCGATLKADAHRYAAFPHGFPDGTPFCDLMAGQWASFSRLLGFDQLLLRDGWYTHNCYSRTGSFGTKASPDPARNAKLTDDLIVLFRKLKQANPHATLVGYSWAHGSVAQWRVGLADLERLIADGAIDAWIDQTWGGAWQDWWSWEPVGWTMQAAYHTLQGAVIARANEQRATPCRHWNVIETWDGWEPWDTLHQVPGKLRWGMWAFSHGTTVTPAGLKVSNGSYCAWVNSKHEDDIWRPEDVAFLKHHLNAAQEDAQGIEEVFGPCMVFHRAILEKLHATTPDDQIGEWLDEQVGLMAKWGLPCMSVTRSEWLPRVAPKLDGLLLQNPTQLDGPARTAITLAIDAGKPVVLIGRADWIDAELLRRAGARVKDQELLPPWFQMATLTDPADYPLRNAIHYARLKPVEADVEQTMLQGRGTALTTRGREQNLLYWMPPDWFEPGHYALRQTQFGSLASHSLTARLVNAAGKFRVEDVPFVLPVAVQMWRSRGRIRLLLGNLETGIVGDARTPRSVSLVINRTHLRLDGSSYVWQDLDDQTRFAPTLASGPTLHYTLPLAPEASRVLTLIPG